jgi:hypothetical protein
LDVSSARDQIGKAREKMTIKTASRASEIMLVLHRRACELKQPSARQKRLGGDERLNAIITVRLDLDQHQQGPAGCLLAGPFEPSADATATVLAKAKQTSVAKPGRVKDRNR